MTEWKVGDRAELLEDYSGKWSAGYRFTVEGIRPALGSQPEGTVLLSGYDIGGVYSFRVKKLTFVRDDVVRVVDTRQSSLTTSLPNQLPNLLRPDWIGKKGVVEKWLKVEHKDVVSVKMTDKIDPRSSYSPQFWFYSDQLELVTESKKEKEKPVTELVSERRKNAVFAEVVTIVRNNRGLCTTGLRAVEKELKLHEDAAVDGYDELVKSVGKKYVATGDISSQTLNRALGALGISTVDEYAKKHDVPGAIRRHKSSSIAYIRQWSGSDWYSTESYQSRPLKFEDIRELTVPVLTPRSVEGGYSQGVRYGEF